VDDYAICGKAVVFLRCALRASREIVMNSFSRPSPAEVQAYIRRGRAERSRTVCAFLGRVIAALSRRPVHPVAPPKTA
jgi:hypothetical protein